MFANSVSFFLRGKNLISLFRWANLFTALKVSSSTHVSQAKCKVHSLRVDFSVRCSYFQRVRWIRGVKVRISSLTWFHASDVWILHRLDGHQKKIQNRKANVWCSKSKKSTNSMLLIVDKFCAKSVIWLCGAWLINAWCVAMEVTESIFKSGYKQK